MWLRPALAAPRATAPAAPWAGPCPARPADRAGPPPPPPTPAPSPRCRVYAYTTSAVQVSILRLFVRCDVLLPNLFVGTITRDSVREALSMGLGAEQVVAYMRDHAHPRVANNVPVVPGVSEWASRLAPAAPTPQAGREPGERWARAGQTSHALAPLRLQVVADQIRLWHQELTRLKTEDAMMYSNWESHALFAATAAYAESLKAVAFRDDEKQLLLVPRKFHDLVRNEIRRLKATGV